MAVTMPKRTALQVAALWRVTVAFILGFACGAKLLFGYDDGGWTPHWLFYMSMLVELAIAGSSLLSRRAWPMVLAGALATIMLAFHWVHRGDPRPCGCTGGLHFPQWIARFACGLVGVFASLGIATGSRVPMANGPVGPSSANWPPNAA